MIEYCTCCKKPTPDCKVMAELRLLSTAEGRKRMREEYYEELRARAKELEGQQTPAEAWHHAQKAGVPYEALQALKAGPRDCLALQKAREFCRARDALFLLLLGPTGVGKTVAAALVVADFCGRWEWNSQPGGKPTHPVEYVDAARVTRLSVFGEADKDFLERLRECRLLVLEDCGDEGTELGKGVLVELLMHRHATRRRTVLTSNLNVEPFKKRYGDAVADRIRSTGIIPNLHGEKSRRDKRPERP